MWNIVLVVFLVAHGLIHLSYVAPAPAAPNYPFNLSKSWLVTAIGLDEPSVRLLGIGLTTLTVIGFVLCGFAGAGIIIPQYWASSLLLASSIVSLLLLFLFWHSWLVLGVTVDITLLVALLRFGWQPFSAFGA